MTCVAVAAPASSCSSSSSSAAPWIPSRSRNSAKFGSRLQPRPPSSSSSSSSSSCFRVLCHSGSFSPSIASRLKFLLHDALDSSGVQTSHAREAREGFFSQIQKLSDVERETSISINRYVDLGKTALHIAAEDDSLVSHSSVPLPVEDFIDRLDDLSMGYCPHYNSSFRSSPESFLDSLERYLYD